MPMGWGGPAPGMSRNFTPSPAGWRMLSDIYTLTCTNRKCSFLEHLRIFVKGQLKSRKFSLFLQPQPDSALKTLEIHKGFLRIFALNPSCVCETVVIFFVFRCPWYLDMISQIKINAVFTFLY